MSTCESSLPDPAGPCDAPAGESDSRPQDLAGVEASLSLAGWLRVHGMSVEELARHMSMPVPYVRALVCGSARVTPRAAMALEWVTGCPSSTWLPSLDPR